MKSIRIGSHDLLIKDYHCDDGYGYEQKEDGKLWLYVNITNKCNGNCPFCINPSSNVGDNPFNLHQFRETLSRLHEYVYGVSITGGEPMLDPKLVDEVVSAIVNCFGHSVEIDIVTNGTNLISLLDITQLRSIDSVHLSRHRIDDVDNNHLFGFEAPSAALIKNVLERMDDPGKIVFNCILMRNGIDSVGKMADYLEFASSLGVQNTSFIALSQCNEYCLYHYIDPAKFDLSQDRRFHIWNHFCDDELYYQVQQ